MKANEAQSYFVAYLAEARALLAGPPQVTPLTVLT